MKLTGDEEGLKALKKLFATNKEYVRFILKEAETNVDRTSDFRDESGTKYRLIYVAEKAEFKVEKAKK
jgi:hypothetical protein